MSGFDDLASNLGELRGLPSRISREVASGISAKISEQFDAETDPYGNPWSPLLESTVRRKRGDTRILRRTDVMAGNTIARPSSGAGVLLESEDYGQYHQSGTPDMVARTIFPDGEELPDEWQEIIEDATDRAFGDAMR